MTAFRRIPAAPVDVDLDLGPKTHVSFRITLTSIAHARSVEVVGSWDDYRFPTALEQDRRVGRDVWKGVLSANGGLEMGSEHYYYFVVDRKHAIPDPQSPPSSLTVDPRTGRLISVLYVPVELPPSPEPAVPVEHEAPPPPVFVDFDTDIFDDRRRCEPAQRQPAPARRFEPAKPAAGVVVAAKKGSSLRDKLLLRRSSLLGSPELDGHKAKRRRSWAPWAGLQLSMSTSFLRLGYKAAEEEEEEAEAPKSPMAVSRDSEAIADFVDYLRSHDATPVPAPAPIAYPATTAASSVYSRDTTRNTTATGTSTELYSSFCSSEDDENDEVSTPTDDLATRNLPLPRPHYSFDEIKPEPMDVDKSSSSSLGCLRAQVVGEIQWRDEMVGELGYLRSAVV